MRLGRSGGPRFGRGRGRNGRASRPSRPIREVLGKLWPFLRPYLGALVFGSTAERQKIDFDYEIASVQVESDRPPKQLFYIPALLLLGLIVLLQRRRRPVERPAVA